MSQPTYFVQGCPTCGRRLQIRVEYLGRQVICQHCQGQFEADATLGPTEPSTSESAILRRANQLLESVELRRSAVPS
jgi:hypothetical protein